MPMVELLLELLLALAILAYLAGRNHLSEWSQSQEGESHEFPLVSN